MAIKTRFAHVNLISRDWGRLVKFYGDVLGCVPSGPERDLSGEWLDRVTALPGAHLRGVHLRLPGYGEGGPTLEIFTYDSMPERPAAKANEPGFAHLAFAVDDVEAALAEVIAAGGSSLGEVATSRVEGAGMLRVVYARDPEGNIIELQRWS
jgi:catechol 2,3-dioxygenase-like lactoylglutathione lyase family enzyme